MKVLHLYKTFGLEPSGGVEVFIRHLARATSRRGIDNTVLALADEPLAPLETPHYRLVHSRQNLFVASTGFSWSVFADFAKLAQQADVIHYHFPWPFMDLVHLLTRPGKPSVVTYHSDIVRQRTLLQAYRPLMNTFLGKVDAIATTSPNYLASSSVLRRFRDKSISIPIGLDQSLYPAADTAAVTSLRQRYGQRFFLFIGVLRYYKGLQFLLDAMKNAPWPLVIIGSGPEEQELLQQKSRLGLANVHFIGKVDEQAKIDLIAASSAVVFPSHLRSEAFGIGLLEGAMLGKPLICCEIGTGTSFINRDRETGLVVPPADPAALHGAMRTLWDDEALAQQYGVCARQRYLELFTADSLGQSYSELYARVAGR